MTKTFRIGVSMVVFGSGPLICIILLSKLGFLGDPNPNLIGPGILAFLTFWPGVILTIIGLVQSLKKKGPPKLPHH
jgi:hypothetical protein